MSQEKFKVEGLVKTEPQAIKEEYEETHFHAKPLDIKEEYQEDSFYTKPVEFPKSVTQAIKSDTHNIKTRAAADESKRKMNSASPFGSSVNKTTTTLPSPLLFLSKSFQTQLTKKPRLVQTTNSITTSLSGRKRGSLLGSPPKAISEPPPFTFRHPEETVQCPKCCSRPKYKNLRKHLAKHARSEEEEDLKNKLEREKREKEQQVLEAFKARSAEAAARAELKFAQLASQSLEAEIPEEDPAGDMFSWSPPPSP